MKNKLIAMLAIFLINIFTAIAYPVPIGIDGVVYDLDNITRADDTVMFSIQNIDSGFYIEDNLRYDGSYSVAVKGSLGDLIFIKVWTPYHNITKNITIGGVLHGYDLNLNLSVPNKPPVINSTPIIKAYEDILYEYDVEAIDDSNNLIYSLKQFPDNMSINNITGLITWLPLQKDIGFHNISVRVTDGKFYDWQNYTLEVFGINDAPLIISKPKTTAKVSRLYYYDVDAIDVDNDSLVYSLLKKPRHMYINKKNGKILWLPRTAGNYDVIVQVNDSNLTDTQNFSIEVKPHLRRRSRRTHTSLLRAPYVITGLINYSDNNPVGADFEYEITNLQTNETVTGKTLDGFNAYAEVINGQEGDDLQINIGKGNYKETHIAKITGEVVRDDITLNVTEKELFTKSLFPFNISIISWLILLTLPFVLILRIAYLYYKK